MLLPNPAQTFTGGECNGFSKRTFGCVLERKKIIEVIEQFHSTKMSLCPTKEISSDQDVPMSVGKIHNDFHYHVR